MAKAQTHKGTTSKLYEVFIRDSSSTTGGGLADHDTRRLDPFPHGRAG